jgi:3-methylcrotonyl-CoA carboxylase alpha subunit
LPQVAPGGDPWDNASGWRLNGVLRRKLEFADETHTYTLTVAYRGDGWTVEADGMAERLTVAAQDGVHLSLTLGNLAVHGEVVRVGDAFHVFSAAGRATLVYADPMAHAGQAEAESGRLTAPMPGKIVAVLVGPGDTVEKGTPLLILEAMKMEHTIAAPHAGMVKELLYAVGDQVAEGAQLLSFEVGEEKKT